MPVAGDVRHAGSAGPGAMHLELPGEIE